MKIAIRHTITLIIALIATIGGLWAATPKPRLVINIVVGSMRSSDLERYSDNFSEGGFKRLMNGGRNYTNAYLGYSQCSTAAGIATLATGTQPCDHGAIGESWWNYADGQNTTLIGDSKSHPIPFSTGAGNYSAHRLTSPTLGDLLLGSSPMSKQYTIAIDPLSAIVMNGKAGIPFWAESNQTHWTTASAFTDTLPSWIGKYNQNDTNDNYILSRWTPLYKAWMYKNEEIAVMEGIKDKHTKLLSDVNLRLSTSNYGKMCYTPAGNTMVFKFASALVVQERLGIDADTDILNICLDTPRYVAETYGPESLEYEDMLYRLDKDIAEFLTYVYAQVSDPSMIVVTLSADHGTAPSYNPVDGKARERFNSRQMEVIVNAYVSAHHGSDEYILGYANNAIYLNHKTINNKKLNIDDIRDEVAIFALQLRGVASARSSTALRNSSFTGGRGELMQHSFYAARSGDVILDFMPGWIVESNTQRSSSTSGYNYDRHIPLIIYGGGIEPRIIDSRVDPAHLAATLCTLIDIELPWSSDGSTLP
jgi:predicted AlkP superfamily pyrophosphatase or phosphodiesterase